MFHFFDFCFWLQESFDVPIFEFWCCFDEVFDVGEIKRVAVGGDYDLGFFCFFSLGRIGGSRGCGSSFLVFFNRKKYCEIFVHFLVTF
jgi:hypothetical protein